jgi:hypothetical protein
MAEAITIQLVSVGEDSAEVRVVDPSESEPVRLETGETLALGFTYNIASVEGEG